MDEIEEQIKYQVIYPIIDKISQVKWQITDALRFLKMSLDANKEVSDDVDYEYEYEEDDE